MIDRRHPAVLGLIVNGNLLRQFGAIVVREILLKRHRDIVIVDKFTGSHHIAKLIIRYGACGAQINNLPDALFIERIHNDIRIIAIDIARNHELLLDRRVGEQIDI